LALAEPNLEFAPEELPVAILNRITAPTKLIPNPVLAEAPAPKDAGGVKKGPEAIAFEKPSYAEAVETAALPDSSPPYPAEAYSAYRPGKTGSDGTVVQLAEADLPGSPEALYSARPDKTAGADSDVALEEAAVPGSPEALAGRKVAGASGGLAELQSPDVPYPTEGIGAEWPRRAQSGAVAADLDEPGVSSPVATGLGPTAIADARKGPGSPPDAALSDPAIPTPTETLTAGNPNAVAQDRKDSSELPNTASN